MKDSPLGGRKARVVAGNGGGLWSSNCKAERPRYVPSGAIGELCLEGRVPSRVCRVGKENRLMNFTSS